MPKARSIEWRKKAIKKVLREGWEEKKRLSTFFFSMGKTDDDDDDLDLEEKKVQCIELYIKDPSIWRSKGKKSF